MSETIKNIAYGMAFIVIGLLVIHKAMERPQGWDKAADLERLLHEQCAAGGATRAECENAISYLHACRYHPRKGVWQDCATGTRQRVRGLLAGYK